MANESIAIALCQMTSVDQVEANLIQIDSLAREAKDKGATVLFFPENCLYFRIHQSEILQGFAADDEAFARLQALSDELHVSLHLGSVPLQMNGKVFNSSIMISPKKALKATYQKIHLFDISLKDEKPIRESDVFSHGQGPSVLQLNDFYFGQTICYDVRFSELFSFYARQGVDAMLVPSAFLVKTGRDHWEVLLRARAIESQCYVLASAQAGVHRSQKSEGQRETFGNSMIIDPWGKILLQAHSMGPEVIVANLSKDAIQAVRKQIPMASHRRMNGFS